MSDLSALFRAYDVRGDASTIMTPQAAYSIARAFVCYLRDRDGKDALTIVLGSDSRPSSPAIHQGVIEALLKEGVHVLDIGNCSSPMLSTAVLEWKSDGGIMVTASHNIVSDNGLKLCRREAVALSQEDGLEEVRGIAERGIFPRDERSGKVEERSARELYRDAVKRVAGTTYAAGVACDTGWGESALTLPLLGEQLFVIHPENSLRNATHRSTALNVGELTDLRAVLHENTIDWGFAFDSDEDRVGVMHREYGALSTDEVAFVLARWALRKYPKTTVVGDLTLSRDIASVVEAAGGKFVRSRVGHSYVERAMRDSNASFGAESSGHYFFKILGSKDSGIAGMLAFMEAVSEEDVLRALKEEKQYLVTTTTISRPTKAIFLTEELARLYGDAKSDWLDGLSVTYDDWGFVLRESQTEPLWRLVVEQKKDAKEDRSKQVQQHIADILARAQ